MVLQSGLDANESIEFQIYAVSSLGRMVDRYALSLDDDERQNYYKNEFEQYKFEMNLPTATDEDVKKLFE